MFVTGATGWDRIPSRLREHPMSLLSDSDSLTQDIVGIVQPTLPLADMVLMFIEIVLAL